MSLEDRPTPALSLAEFRQRLSHAGVASGTLAVEATGTVFAPADLTVDAVLDDLPVLAGASTQRDLKLKAPIGKGGMGLVLGAEQLALGREVAVKRSHPGSVDRHEASAALIREGRATGALEHPNIVPVHALGKSPEGDVLLVMKRIEGQTWSELLKRRAQPADELSRHLSILVDVCRAVHFAHSRGILHRDLKPENVMVGSFGEVYVLDWGLALTMGTTQISGVPHVDDERLISGTPAYMAPEMALPEGPLDARTDVYLLGGLLHAILTGAPPHRGASVDEKLMSAWTAAPPSLPADAPQELAELCRQALARDRARRPASADAVRVAVEEFMAHASARLFAAEAQGQLAALQRVVDDHLDDDAAAQHAYSAARFGFEGAQRAWPGSPEAKEGIPAAVRLMARYEIGRGHLDAARVLVKALAEPSPDLDEALAALAREQEQRAQAASRAQAVAQDVDLSSNNPRRTVMLMTLSFAWSVFGIVTGFLGRAGVLPQSYEELVGAHLLLLVGLLAFRPWLMKLGRESRAGKTLFEVGVIDLVVSVCVWLGMWKTRAPFELGFAIAQGVTGVAAWGLALVDPRVRVSAAIFLVGMPVVYFAGPYAADLNAVCIGAGFGVGAWLTREPRVAA